MGTIIPEAKAVLLEYPHVFEEVAGGGDVTLAASLATPTARTHAVDAAMRDLRARGVWLALHGWRYDHPQYLDACVAW